MNVAARYNLENLQNRGMEMVLKATGSFLDAHPGSSAGCEQCVFDLLAFTLNHVTPLYGTSLLGSLSGKSRLLQKVEIEIEIAIDEGAKRIARHPSHLETVDAKTPERGGKERSMEGIKGRKTADGVRQDLDSNHGLIFMRI